MNKNTIACISGYRHKYYDKTVKTAKFAYKIITGEGYGDLVINYKPRETDLQKEQRVEITNCASKSIAGKIEGFFKRPYRMDKIRNTLEIKDSAKKDEFLRLIDTFGTHGASLMEWCEKTALNQNGIDPNSLVWVKQKENGFENIVVPACDVLDFAQENGQIISCVIKMQDFVTYVLDNKPKTIVLDLFYSFSNESIEISVLLDDDIRTNSDYYNNFQVDGEISKINNQNYLTFVYPNILGFVPLTRIGYKEDKTANNSVFVTYWDNATELYKEQANRVSEYALSLALHVFLQKVSYYTPCTHTSVADGECRGGIMYPSKKQCQSCKGTGKHIATSSQDVIEIALPNADTDPSIKIISPKDLVHYVELPLGIVEHQKTLVDEFAPKITESVFGVDISHQNNSATTATEVINYYDTAQDAIYEFTKSPKNLYIFCIKTLAAYMGIDLTIDLQYAQQYDLESEKYLVELLKAAKEATASPEIIENITDRLVLKQNKLGGAKLKVYEAMRSHKPFADLSNEMAMSYILALQETDLRKVLYLNFGQISNLIYKTVPNFILLNFQQQANKVKEITAKLSKEIIAYNAVEGISDIANSETDIPTE